MPRCSPPGATLQLPSMRRHLGSVTLFAALLLGGAHASAQDGQAPDGAIRCAETAECKSFGRCSTEGDRCVATTESDCAASTSCRTHGLRCKLDRVAQRCVSTPGAAPPESLVEPGEMPRDPYAAAQGKLISGAILLALSVASILGGGIAFAMSTTSTGQTEETLRDVSWSLLGNGGGMFVTGLPLLMDGLATPRFTVAAPAGGAAMVFRF